MEHFRDGHYVWLRSLVSEAYLHADGDGQGVSLRANRASRNTAWRVHVLYEGAMLVLLQGAAYGRYLAGTKEPALPGHRGLRAEQRDFDDPVAWSITWKAIRSGWGHSIILIHVSSRGLRANGYRWETGVTIDEMHTISPMMHWVVQPIPWTDTIPHLPGPHQPSRLSLGIHRREVRCVRAGPDGLVNENDWVAFRFDGRSVVNLRNELALRLGEAVVFAMCVRAGQYAQLTPLVVDLPLSNDPLYIVILMDGSPAIDELRHPDVDAAESEG